MIGYAKMIAGLALYHVDKFGLDYSKFNPLEENQKRVGLDEANVASSGVAGTEYEYTNTHGEKTYRFGIHKVILDIDMEARLVPSTRAGHYHLYLDKELPEQAYFELLDALTRVGIIEQGYFDFSVARGSSRLRLPWVKKDIEEVPKTPTSQEPIGSVAHGAVYPPDPF